MCKPNCRKCPHAYTADSFDGGGIQQDWFCGHPDNKNARCIEEYVDDNYEIITPNQCPLKMKRRITQDERKQLINKTWGPTDWDDIQEGKVYHLPPVANQKRQDILVIAKTQYCISYKDADAVGTSYTVKHIYKSCDPWYKFLVQHQMDNKIR